MNKPTIIYRPIISEKSIQLGGSNKYTFEVDPRANLFAIKQAIQTLFKVSVKGVNIINIKGKPKRAGRLTVKRKDRKKAIITLVAGQSIKLFEDKATTDGN